MEVNSWGLALQGHAVAVQNADLFFDGRGDKVAKLNDFIATTIKSLGNPQELNDFLQNVAVMQIDLQHPLVPPRLIKLLPGLFPDSYKLQMNLEGALKARSLTGPDVKGLASDLTLENVTGALNAIEESPVIGDKKVSFLNRCSPGDLKACKESIQAKLKTEKKPEMICKLTQLLIKIGEAQTPPITLMQKMENCFVCLDKCFPEKTGTNGRQIWVYRAPPQQGFFTKLELDSILQVIQVMKEDVSFDSFKTKQELKPKLEALALMQDCVDRAVSSIWSDDDGELRRPQQENEGRSYREISYVLKPLIEEGEKALKKLPEGKAAQPVEIKQPIQKSEASTGGGDLRAKLGILNSASKGEIAKKYSLIEVKLLAATIQDARQKAVKQKPQDMLFIISCKEALNKLSAAMDLLTITPKSGRSAAPRPENSSAIEEGEDEDLDV